MADDYSIFGQLPRLNPSGKPRDAKEVPVDRESRRKAKRKIKKGGEASPGERVEHDLEEEEKNGAERKSSGKVVDIII